jgi:hypothetical protein
MAILASLRPERPNAVVCNTILLCPIVYTHLFIEVVPYETGRFMVVRVNETPSQCKLAQRRR